LRNATLVLRSQAELQRSHSALPVAKAQESAVPRPGAHTCSGARSIFTGASKTLSTRQQRNHGARWQNVQYNSLPSIWIANSCPALRLRVWDRESPWIHAIIYSAPVRIQSLSLLRSFPRASLSSISGFSIATSHVSDGAPPRVAGRPAAPIEHGATVLYQHPLVAQRPLALDSPALPLPLLLPNSPLHRLHYFGQRPCRHA
jgi:hypothetical protein